MALEFWPSVGAGLLAVLAGALLLEACLTPRPRRRGRPLSAWAAQGGIGMLLYALELILFQRAGFGAAMALSSLLLLVVVNNDKHKLLREPFLFQDFEYFTDLLRHPRLYLPFFGVGKALAGLAAFLAAVYAGLTLEPSLPARGGWAAYLSAVAGLVGGGVLLLRYAARRPAALCFDPAADLRQLGFLGFLWAYGQAERRPLAAAAHPFAPPPQSSARPDLVVVQSESFFDPRPLYPAIAPGVMAEFDRLRDAAQRHGRLTVPAWGANTVRTEFAFLSGRAAHTLGVHRFNPYRRLAGAGIATLASYLRGLGYRTVCLHPYPASFYRRDRRYPAMGFDEFIDIAHFAEAERCGAYVGDVALGRSVRRLLENPAAPLFVFVITMENHGPLHWESVAADDAARLYQTPPPPGFDDLTIYLRHLENANRMLAELRDALRQSPRDGWLCWYGDHVPIMPKVYAERGFADGRTDYFIWGRNGAPTTAAFDLCADELAAALLEIAMV